MTLLLHIKIPGALILASDCRVTGRKKDRYGKINYVVTDSEQKTFPIGRNMAVSYCGNADPNGLPASFLLGKAVSSIHPSTVQEAAASMQEWFSDSHIPRPSLLFSGYSAQEPMVLSLPSDTDQFKDQYPDRNVYGITTMGDNRIAEALIHSGPVDFHQLRIRDAVSFSELLIKTTAGLQRIESGIQTVSEACDILVMTASDLRWVRRDSEMFGQL